MPAKRGTGRGYYMISAVSAKYNIHPQTLRLYEREGLLRPRRSLGNARHYTATDIERLEHILSLSRELGVNLAGIDVILNMRERMAALQDEIARLMQLLEEQLLRASGDGGPNALVRLAARPLVARRGTRSS